MNDAEPLRHYAATGSQDAFAALVQQFLPLVYAAALRRLGGDVHRAQDVAQLVFIALARNARALVKHPDLTGWLFTTTRFLAAKTLRTERRRQFREQAAGAADPVMSSEPHHAPDNALPAVLDDVLMELRQLDRQVLLLRFYRGLRLAEIGAQLGATDNAVQKRIDRALEVLKEKLGRRGITSSAAALTAAFEQHAAIATPVGLAGAVTGAGLACAPGAAGMLTISGLVGVTKLQVGLAAAAIVGTSTALVWQVRENSALRETVTQGQAGPRVLALQKTAAELSRRAAAAEADAAALQTAVQAANAASAASAPAPRQRVVTDAREQVRATLSLASRLAQAGKLQEALETYLKCYREVALRSRPLVDQQLIMSGIQNLGRSYPPALVALRELRDTALQKLQATPDNRDLLSEFALLNERLGDAGATVALYDTLPPDDPRRQCLGAIAYEAFVAARRYADALVGKSFGSMVNELEMGIRHSAGVTGLSLASHRSFVIKGALSNIEALTGAGQIEEARMLTEKLLAFDGSEPTRAALEQHLARAHNSDSAPRP